jgi:hypothetical protein
MAIQWAIVNMQYIVQDGFVVVADWTCTASQGSDSKYVYGQQTFPYEPNQPGFIPYDQLTQANVIGWVHSQLGAEKVSEQEALAQAELDRIIAPAIASGLPWDPNATASIFAAQGT